MQWKFEINSFWLKTENMVEEVWKYKDLQPKELKKWTEIIQNQTVYQEKGIRI